MIKILLEIIKRNLESDEDVLVCDSGKFCVKDKYEQRGRKAVAGVFMMLQAKLVVTFRCSQQSRDKVNENQT